MRPGDETRGDPITKRRRRRVLRRPRRGERERGGKERAEMEVKGRVKDQ